MDPTADLSLNELWTLTLDSASATSSDVQSSQVEIECYLNDYPSQTVSTSFNVIVHEITGSFADQYVLVNGERTMWTLGSWALNSGDPNYDESDFYP